MIRRRHCAKLPAAEYVCDPSANVHPGAEVDVTASVTVEERAVVCEDVLLLTHDHEPGTGRIVASPLVIGAGAFIGARAIVLKGCDRIGAGAYIGAGAVVSRDVPERELWAGNPARKVRSL